MNYENLHYQVREPLAVVALDRPKVLNALNRATLNELEAVFQQIAADESIRCVLLTGAGEKAFAAGADIQELSEVNAAQGKELAERGQRVFDQIANCPKPVIACVNGFALGGGCELALACTLRLASDNAKFGQPEVKLGLIPGYGGTQRLPRLIGKSAALKLLLTGALIPAEEAYRLGLVDEVVAPDRLMSRAEDLATLIAGMAPIAIRHCLAAVQEGIELSLSAGLELEASRFGICCASEDKAEGTRAFLEKRIPTWTGR
jgi:enoyl-CoA hydratase